MRAVTVRTQRAGARMLGVGAYRPGRVVENAEICRSIDSTDEWIRQRSGIVSRRFAAPDETVVSMGATAGARAIAASGIAPDRIDTVVFASMSNLQQSPPAAPRVGYLAGATTAAALDLGAACAGFCHSLAVADSLIRAGTSEYVLIVGSEKMTDIIDPTDRSTAFLFGDGAGPDDQPGIGPVVWGSDGSKADLIAHQEPWTSVRDKPDFWPTMRMAGQDVFRWAIGQVSPVAQAAIDQAGLDVTDLAAFVPHQANARIIDKMVTTLKVPPNVVIAKDVATTGNTSAASIPLAIDDILRNNPGLQGWALLTGFGAGLAHASLVAKLPYA